MHEKNYEGSITIVGEKGTIKIGGQYLNTIEFWNVEDYPLPRSVQFTDKPNQYSSYSGSASNHDKVIADVIATLTPSRPARTRLGRRPSRGESHSDDLSVAGERGAVVDRRQLPA